MRLTLALAAITDVLLCLTALAPPAEAAEPAQYNAAADGSEPERKGSRELPGLEERGKAIPEMLVKGRRSLNADIERTEDDVQPYVVFTKEEIQRSRSPDLEQFLLSRLPMNTTASLGKQFTSSNTNGANSLSNVNLRGLGQSQTLILLNGRPMASTGMRFLNQSDINGIPLRVIERIEVLPSTGSGIYGGRATGGVVNIITRQDYVGLEVGIEHNDSFDGGAGQRRYDLSAGVPLGERTHVTIAFSHAQADPLLRGERDFARRAREIQVAGNPSVFYDASTPPTGYTTNIRNSVPNQNLQLDPQYGGAVLSSPFTFVPVGYAGISSDAAAALAANAGQYNLGLPADVTGTRGSLLADTTEQSAMLTLRHSFTPRIDAFLDASWLNNEADNYSTSVTNTVTLPANAPNNPFTTPIVVRYPLPELAQYAHPHGQSETIRVAGGVIVRLPADWTGAVDYTWSRYRRISSAYFPIVGDPDGTGPGLPVSTALTTGALDVMRDLNAFPLDYSLYLMPRDNAWGDNQGRLSDAALRLSGPVFELPGGPITVSAVVEHQNEESPSVYQYSTNTSAVPNVLKTWHAEQDVDSYYLEARVPVVGPGNAMRFLRMLELQASGRQDRYDTKRPAPPASNAPSKEGPFAAPTYFRHQLDSTDYTLGLRFAPSEDVVLRASTGTGFLPPTIAQLFEQPTTPVASTVTDPKRGNTTYTTTIQTFCCGNPDLEPEESESWSAGAIFTPRFLPGLRLSVDYTHIEKTGEITLLTTQQLVDIEDLRPGSIIRGPVSPADAALGYTAGMVTGVRRRQVNIAKTLVKAYDIQLDYARPTERFGNFQFYAVATQQRTFTRQVGPNDQPFDTVGFPGGPLEWRGNVGLTWERGPWMLAWNAQYFHSAARYAPTATPAGVEATIRNDGAATKPKQVYHDVLASYTFDAASTALFGTLADTELSVGIRNVFDKDPPLTSTSIDGYLGYSDPRLRVYSLALRKSF